MLILCLISEELQCSEAGIQHVGTPTSDMCEVLLKAPNQRTNQRDCSGPFHLLQTQI